MTTDVVTVSPDTTVEAIAEILMAKKISGVPVADENGAILGIVTEGDLIQRQAGDVSRFRQGSWWLRLVSSDEDSASDYIKSHGMCADDIMSRKVLTVEEDTPVGDIARILADNRIKRVPVVQGGALVGIVSRSNLLRGLATRDRARKSSVSDRSLKDEILETVRQQDWVSHGTLNVIVTEGVVELWGWVESEQERSALLLIAESVDGVEGVEDHLGFVPRYLQSD
jgi:CBS-domain-containing membrane protein